VSIRARIALFGLAVVLTVLTCFSAGIYGLLSAGVPGSQDKQLADRAAAAVAEVQAAPAADFTPSRPLAPVRPATDNDIFVLILDADGRPLSYTGGQDPQIPAGLLAQARTAGRVTAGTVAIDGVPVRVAVRTWSRPDLGGASGSGFVVAAQPVRRRRNDLAGILVVLVGSGILTLIAGAVAIWLVTGRALRPLRQLTATADEIGRSPDRTRRLPPAPRQDDVGRLTGSFNGMLDRLEEAHRRTATALAAQQRFVADASHELRTPLTTIRNNAGFLLAHPDGDPADRAAALADLDAEAARMSRLVDDLLTLARADGGVPVTGSTVDVGALVDDVCRKAGAQHPDRKVHCAGAPITLCADAGALTRLVWILLDNAVKHTGDGGNIWVAVTSRGTSGPTGAPAAATLEVSDDGDGIPPGQEQQIFARFHQADPARSPGSGLGLSIASWIAYAHRGTISAANNDRGGATFTVQLSSIS
jgi:two-component system, OmpR family, sensor kinase